jgi:hypothetical protein
MTVIFFTRSLPNPIGVCAFLFVRTQGRVGKNHSPQLTELKR